jgi:hypothetical protein
MNELHEPGAREEEKMKTAGAKIWATRFGLEAEPR